MTFPKKFTDKPHLINKGGLFFLPWYNTRGRKEVIMKKHMRSQLMIGLGLIVLSVILHFLHVMLFKDPHHTMIFLVADVAFVPLEVFFVTMVLDKILEKREKEGLIIQLNMLVGLFYSKLGQELLDVFVSGDEGIEEIRQKCEVDLSREKMNFKAIKKTMHNHKHKLDISVINLQALKTLLDKQESFLVNMISNPALSEHDTFSDLLLSLFHLREELELRQVKEDQSLMQDYVLDHIRVDINRAYRYLAVEWVDYMEHLEEKYPFLYVTAIMKNPYDQRSPEEIENKIMKHYENHQS